MGQRWSSSKGAFSLQYAEYSVQGKREGMEDAFIAELDFGKNYKATGEGPYTQR